MTIQMPKIMGRALRSFGGRALSVTFLLTVSPLSKSFARRALFDDVSLQVNRVRLDLRSFSSRRGRVGKGNRVVSTTRPHFL